MVFLRPDCDRSHNFHTRLGPRHECASAAARFQCPFHQRHLSAGAFHSISSRASSSPLLHSVARRRLLLRFRSHFPLCAAGARVAEGAGLAPALARDLAPTRTPFPLLFRRTQTAAAAPPRI
jgi:hypothetical protein